MAMTIKDVSKKYNIAQDTLRYYEQAGMIPPVTRTAGASETIRTGSRPGWNWPCA